MKKTLDRIERVRQIREYDLERLTYLRVKRTEMQPKPKPEDQIVEEPLYKKIERKQEKLN
jgi:hypothetical protein